jgi:hypothetical protein
VVEVKVEIPWTTEPSGTLSVAGGKKQLIDVSAEVRPVVVTGEPLKGRETRWVLEGSLIEAMRFDADSLVPGVPAKLAMPGLVRVETNN